MGFEHVRKLSRIYVLSIIHIMFSICEGTCRNLVADVLSSSVQEGDQLHLTMHSREARISKLNAGGI